MRSAVLAGPGEILVKEFALPEPGPGQVRVKLEGCGVCASNLGPWSGPEWLTYPGEPGGMGHEGWDVIEAVGPGVENADTLRENHAQIPEAEKQSSYASVQNSVRLTNLAVSATTMPLFIPLSHPLCAFEDSSAQLIRRQVPLLGGHKQTSGVIRHPPTTFLPHSAELLGRSEARLHLPRG